ncbi:unnamed protein product [Bursaphelenchus okinawaensis]|uniref:Uncharacterized protein n=1 Tax=Bursaphelenchus okinawaensis TaxID=465554 RepID=A0A811JUE6_9BILA|nr:unnamed protein product [Bursaphelenchus okinawaensis]CAG9084389.1 unnamed protein product [Bursaphelenchus okinawaensis]
MAKFVYTKPDGEGYLTFTKHCPILTKLTSAWFDHDFNAFKCAVDQLELSDTNRLTVYQQFKNLKIDNDQIPVINAKNGDTCFLYFYKLMDGPQLT